MSITIPKSLLQSLQTSFEAEAKRVAKDVSKILNIEEKELIQHLKKMPKIQITIQDDSDSLTSCPILLQGGSLIRRCKKPCILGTSRCVEHQSVGSVPSIPDHISNVTKICQSDLQDSFWCDESTKFIYDNTGNVVGDLTEDNIMNVYTFEE